MTDSNDNVPRPSAQRGHNTGITLFSYGLVLQGSIRLQGMLPELIKYWKLDSRMLEYTADHTEEKKWHA